MSALPLAKVAGLAAIVARGEPASVELVSACACGRRLPRDVPRGLARCAGCEAQERRAEERARLRARLPAPFREASLDGPLPVPDEAREAARAWLGGGAPLLTIVGPATGSGKTTLATAVANAAIDRGASPVWVPARELDPTHADQDRARAALRLAERAAFVVLDGLGKELAGAGAEAGAGVAAQRRAWVQRWIGELHEAERRRFVVTVDLTSQQLVSEYGADALRRIASPSARTTVIVLRRPRALDVERF